MHETKTQLHKPTREEIKAAQGRTIPDVIASGLKVLFCGINPALYSAAVEHHFAHPGNRFWKMLHDAGFTTRLLSPFEENELLKFGYGITDLVERATAQADEIKLDELTEGAQRLTEKVKQYQPKCVSVLGIGAYRRAFIRSNMKLGQQGEMIGESRLWVLPNPSGLNTHYPSNRLRELFKELYKAIGRRA